MPRFAFALLAATLLASPAFAGAGDVPALVLDAGVFGLRGDNREGEFTYGAEYRFGNVTKLLGYGIEPAFGIQNVEARSDHWYAYAGFLWNFPVWNNKLTISPNFAVSSYQNGDDGKDLGGPLEFRSGIELSYEFDNKMRLGMAVHHLSNASIYEDNDGVETFLVNFAVPAGYFR